MIDEQDVLVTIPEEHIPEEKNNEFLWYSCLLGQTDSRLIHFLSVFSISVGVIIFSSYQLSNSNSCESDNLYVGLLTLTLGIWLKSPIF